MTNKELKDILMKYPEDCIVIYRHNIRGRIDIDYIDYTEETSPAGNKYRLLTLEGSFEEE